MAEKTRRVAVTAAEERVLAEYRQKTQEERAFNNALDCVLDLCVPHELSQSIKTGEGLFTIENVDKEFQRIRASIERMRKPV